MPTLTVFIRGVLCDQSDVPLGEFAYLQPITAMQHGLDCMHEKTPTRTQPATVSHVLIMASCNPALVCREGLRKADSQTNDLDVAYLQGDLPSAL